jgi:hypothetical protein
MAYDSTHQRHDRGGAGEAENQIIIVQIFLENDPASLAL